MAAKNRWESYREEKTAQQTAGQQDSGQTSQTQKNRWEEYKEKNGRNSEYGYAVAASISERLDYWLKNHDNYLKNYQFRNAGRKYSYEDSYVSDSGSWLDTVSKQKSAFDAEADSILAYMDQYKGYLDEEWMKSVRDTLTSARGQQKSIVDSSAKDNQWWNSFGSEELVKQFGSAEEAYKYYQWDDGLRTKYAGATGDDIFKALDTLGVSEERDWLKLNQGKIFADTIRGSTDFQDYVNTGSSLDYTDFGTETRHRGKSRRQRSTTSIDKYRAASLALAEHYGNKAPLGTYGQYEGDVAIFRTMDDKEFENLAYCIAYDKQNGTNTAEQYVDLMEEELSSRRGTDIGQKVTSIDIPVIEDLAVLGYGAMAGIDNFAFGLEQSLSDKELAYYPSYYANAHISDSLDGIGYYAHSAATNIGNMAPSILVSSVAAGLGMPGKVAEGLGSATMGVSAAGSAYKEALSKGYDQESARAYSTLVGASEGSLQYLIGGVGKLGGMSGKLAGKISLIDNALLRGAAKFGASIGSEILEEEIQNFLEPAFRSIIFGEDYDAPTIDEIIETAIVTALSTGVLEGGSTYHTTKEETALNREAVKQYGDKTTELVGKGKSFERGTEARTLADKYYKQMQGKNGKEGKALTGAQIRNLLEANQEQITAQDMKKIQLHATKRLNDLGQTKDVDKIAQLATKWATGGKLTATEKHTLTTSEYGSRVANELHPKNIASGEFSTEWAENIGTESVNYAAYNKKELVRKLVEAMSEDPAQYKTLTDRTGTEGRFAVSENGEATIRGTDKTFDFDNAEVVTVKGGQMTFKTADGSNVSASNIDFADESQSFLVSAVSNIENITPAAATAVMHDIVDMEKPLGAQLNGIDEAYTYGFNGYSVADLKSGDYAPSLTSEQMMSAYRLGQSARKISDVEADAPIVKMRTAAEAKLTAEQKTAQQKSRIESDDVEVYFEDGGKVTKFDEHTGEYDEKRMAAVNTAKFLSKMGIGGKYYFFESYVNADGERVYKDANGNEVEAPNGVYRDSDGSIHIDLNAGDDGQGTALFTLGHELTHFVKAQSRKQFKILGDLVTEAFDKTDLSMHDRVVAKQDFLSKKRGHHVTYTEAFEEVVADAMSTMLTDGSFHEKIMEIKVKDRGLFKTIKRFFDKMIAKFRKVYAELTPDQKDAQDIREVKEMLDKIQSAFAEALVEASDNFRASMESVVEAKSEAISADEIITDGAVVTDGEGEKHSIRSMKADIAEGKMFEDLKTVCGWTDAQVITLRKQLNDLVDYMIPYRNILDMNESYGREGRRFSPYKPNSDPLYKISMDFSTLCSKRLLTQYVIENLQLREGRPMSPEEQMAIRDMLNEYRKVEKGLQVACAMCYVEAARLKSPKQIQRWLDDPTPHLVNYFAQKNSEFNATVKKAQADFKESKGYDRDTPKKNMKPADVKKLNEIGPKLRSQYQLSAEEQAIVDKAKTLPNSTYLTAGNLANLSESDSVIYDAYTAFVRTATRSKSLETDEPYYYGDSRRDNGNGIIVSDSFIEAVNRENGMRFSSWSDWRIQHMLDYITAVIDNSVRGAAMHGYTKFGEEVRVLGKTGMMFNMSGVAGTQTGLNEDGSLSFSDTESIDVNEAIQLREEFPDTAGLQCIGVGDAHITALLRSDIIDYVIPYHVSGLNAALRRMADIQGWKDYTSTQHAAIDKSIKFENAVDKEHWHEEPVYSEFFVGYETGMTGIEAMRASAEKYKQLCRDRGLTPKFNQFAQEENYWKLLIDRKMVNQKTGKLIQQKAVTPTFDFDAIKQVVDRHVQNYDAGLEARALNHIVENWDSIPQRIKDLKKGNAKAKQTKKSMDTLANQTVAAQPKETGEKYSYRGKNKDGIEVYETSDEVKNLTRKERQQLFLDIMANEYRGRTAKFIRNGHAYYATFDERDVNKNIYGDKRSDKKGYRAKINAGADGDIFELVENAQYDGSKPEKGKKIAAHQGVGYWDYFIKTVQIDNTVFNMNANVRKKADGAFVYSIQLNENKKIKASPPLGLLLKASNGVTNASANNVTQPAAKVNKEADRNSDRDSSGKQLTEDQLEFFENSKVRDENGNLYVLYHGSRSPLFTEFDVTEGVWLTPDQRYAEVYAETWRSWRDDDKNLTGLEQSVYADPDYRVYKMYANITNPLDLGEINDEFDRGQMNRLAKLLGVPVSRIRSLAYYNGQQTVAFVYEVTRDMDFIDIAREKGYDGFVASEKGRKTFCAFNAPNQVKLTTNEVPSGFYDIRYSERTSDSVSNRHLLANAFEGIVRDSVEYEMIQEYKDHIKDLNELETKLHQLNSLTRELTFGKAEVDDAMMQRIQNLVTRSPFEVADGDIIPNGTKVNAKDRGNIGVVRGYDSNSNQYTVAFRNKHGLSATVRISADMIEPLRRKPKKVEVERKAGESNKSYYTRLLTAEAAETAASINRYDKRLLNMEASEPLRKVIERERKKEAQKTKDHVKEIQQNKKLRAEQVELRHKIRKAVRDLDKILNRGNKKLNVKEDMQNVVTTALKAADILFTENYGTYDMLRNGIGADLSDAEEELVNTCTRMLKDLDKMPTDGYDNWQAYQEAENRLKAKMGKLKDVFARERKRLNNTTVSSILGELADAYKSLEKSEQSYVQGAYTEAVHNFLKSLQSEVGGTIVKDMTKDQLESVYAAYKMVLTAVRTANKMFNEELKLSREQLGNAVIAEVIAAGGNHGLWTKTEMTRSQASWNNTKPVWVANRIGSDTFSKLMNGLFKGQYDFAVDIDEAKQFKLSMDQKYHPRNWNAEKLYEFESSTGRKFSLNLQQIMSLYAFSKREQAYSHLLNGGFVFESNSTVIVDKKGIKRTYLHDGATSYKLNEATLAEIIGTLTKEQKAYVDEMQAYLSDVMGAKGNEVSMKLYGIQMFKEKFYFPLRSSGAYMERAKEAEMKKQQGQINLVNSGFTHAVKPEAKNPIILSGFMDVWAEHCNEMSMYHSMVLPMEDFRKVYNYSTVHDDQFDSASVYQTIQDAYGKAATDYIDQLYRELNAGATVDPRETPFKARISKFKKAAVMLSGSVVVQQFSAIGRAYAVIDPKHFIGAKVNSGTNLSAVEEMKKYAPVAIIKEMGGFDTGTKGSAKSYIMAEQYGKGERLKGIVKDEQYRSDLMGFFPAKADELTWCAIWEAAKRDTRANHPKMDVKSEEFLKLAGERFSEVIEKTQVYDSVLARSANMRSKGAFMAMATAFMAEPTATINLIEDAIRSGKAKNIARTFGAVAVSIVLNNALASIVYAMRDDDEDETFIEKYFQSFTSGMIDDINPMSYYPFLKDVYSLFQGYDVERADMSVIADLRDAMKKAVGLIGKDTSEMDEVELAAHWKKVNEVMMSLLDAGCSMFGIPVKNVRRDANGIINAWNTVGKDLTERDTSWNSFWDKVGAAAKDTVPILAWTKDRAKQDKLYEAIIEGDKAYVARLKSGYKTEDAYNSAVRKALRENDTRIHDAAQAKYDGNSDEYKRIFREIQKEGRFSFDDIMEAINSELSAIKSGLKSDTVSSDYSSTDFINAMMLGETEIAEAMREDIISAKVANGKTQEEAEESFASSVATATRNAYDSGLLDEAGVAEILTAYADMDDEEADGKINYWSFIKANPQYRDDLTQSNVEKYYEFAEPAEIPLDVFVQYLNGTSGLQTIRDEWGDEVKSKREQVLEVIDSLPLTWQQKDALYLAEGYAESKIWDVPW